jgi:hypothetical protein
VRNHDVENCQLRPPGHMAMGRNELGSGCSTGRKARFCGENEAANLWSDHFGDR